MNEKTADFSLKIANPGDERAINEVLDASFSSLLSARYDDILLADILPKVTQINPLLLNSGTYYTANDSDGRIMGTGGWTHARPGTGERIAGEAHIRHFATHPDYVGRGIGRALFDYCLKTAKREKVTSFECYSTLNAENFYKSLGFESIKIFDLEMGDGLTFPSVLMKVEI